MKPDHWHVNGAVCCWMDDEPCVTIAAVDSAAHNDIIDDRRSRKGNMGYNDVKNAVVVVVVVVGG